MTRATRILLAVACLALTAVPAAQAHTRPPRTVTIRAPVPAAGDFSIVTFEMSIGGEGKHHRKQPVRLELVNHHEPGVFALAHLRPEPHRPGRFLGVLEVFHRTAGATTALSSGLASPAPGPALAPPARAGGGYSGDEFLVRAHNERVIKETIKDNIVELAESQDLGPDEFCDAQDEDDYVLGNWIIFAAYIIAGPVTGLPTNTDPAQLAIDAADELCDEVDDLPLYGDIATLLHYLGHAPASSPTSPTSPPTSSPTSPTFPSYPIGFSGQFTFVEPGEVQLAGSFSWSGVDPTLDTTYPVTAIKLIVPPSSTSMVTTPRAVSDYICPSQLPTAAIVTSTYPNDTLMCSGGTLPINQSFTLNVQTLPAPSIGMGATIIASQNGAYLNPFTVSGP